MESAAIIVRVDKGIPVPKNKHLISYKKHELRMLRELEEIEEERLLFQNEVSLYADELLDAADCGKVTRIYPSHTKNYDSEPVKNDDELFHCGCCYNCLYYPPFRGKKEMFIRRGVCYLGIGIPLKKDKCIHKVKRKAK